MVAMAAIVVIAFCLWRLAGTYLAGRVFTVDAALWLRRTGIAGLAGLIVSVIARVVVASIITGRWVPMSPLGFFYILPQDVIHLIFVIFVLALAHIFKAAAEMGQYQGQIRQEAPSPTSSNPKASLRRARRAQKNWPRKTATASKTYRC